jgi:hypothetical protein
LPWVSGVVNPSIPRSKIKPHIDPPSFVFDRKFSLDVNFLNFAHACARERGISEKNTGTVTDFFQGNESALVRSFVCKTGKAYGTNEELSVLIIYTYRQTDLEESHSIKAGEALSKWENWYIQKTGCCPDCRSEALLGGQEETDKRCTLCGAEFQVFGYGNYLTGLRTKAGQPCLKVV